jgi:hypothetical protein
VAERTAWTDERLDDRMSSMDARFDRIEIELREFRAEMREGFRGVRADMSRLQDRMVQGAFGLAAAQFVTLITVILTN